MMKLARIRAPPCELKAQIWISIGELRVLSRTTLSCVVVGLWGASVGRVNHVLTCYDITVTTQRIRRINNGIN